MSAALALAEAPGDVLSPSQANTYLSCSARWAFRKIRKLPDPPTSSLTLGNAIHDVVGENFAQKMETRKDLPVTGAVALYRKAWSERAPETMFREDEDPNELRAMGETLTVKYLEESAPKIDPAAVEINIQGRIGGVSVRGIIDLLDTTGRIIDLKSAAKKPTEISSDYRFQVATYIPLTPGASGEARVDTLVKTNKPQLISQTFSLDQSDVDATNRIYPLVQRAIRAQIFTPNRSHFMCSRRYCSFWRACEKEFGGKVAD